MNVARRCGAISARVAKVRLRGMREYPATSTKGRKLPGLCSNGVVHREPGGGIDPVAGLVEELPRQMLGRNP